MIVYIEFTRPKNFNLFSLLVRLIEMTKYSHVRLRFNDIVYEASGTSVHFKGKLAQEYRQSEIIDSYKLDLAEHEYVKLMKLCMENAGIDYGFKQLIGIALVKLFKLKKNPFSDGRKSQVCSEIVGRFLKEILNIGHSLDLDVASPKDINKILGEKYVRN